jgi:hypothetical protein
MWDGLRATIEPAERAHAWRVPHDGVDVVIVAGDAVEASAAHRQIDEIRRQSSDAWRLWVVVSSEDKVVAPLALAAAQADDRIALVQVHAQVQVQAPRLGKMPERITPNRLAGAAWHGIAALAAGRAVHFVSADTQLLPTFVERLLPLMRDGVDVVSSAMIRRAADGGLSGETLFGDSMLVPLRTVRQLAFTDPSTLDRLPVQLVSPAALRRVEVATWERDSRTALADALRIALLDGDGAMAFLGDAVSVVQSTTDSRRADAPIDAWRHSSGFRRRQCERDGLHGAGFAILELLRDWSALRATGTDMSHVDAVLASELSAWRSLRPRAAAPAISIIVPLYNQAEYINDALVSVRAQRLDDWECIVVDDGSTDDSAANVDRFIAATGDHRIRLVRQSNAGLASARNAGIEVARGDVIAPLDSDDVLHPLYLLIVTAILESSPQFGLVFPDYQAFGVSEQRFRTGPLRLPDMAWSNRLPVATCFRRRVWEASHGYNPNMKWGYEDWDFWLSAVERGEHAHHVPEVLFFYRTKANSMITTAMQRDAWLRARLVLNHPGLHSAEVVARATALIASHEANA